MLEQFETNIYFQFLDSKKSTIVVLTRHNCVLTATEWCTSVILRHEKNIKNTKILDRDDSLLLKQNMRFFSPLKTRYSVDFAKGLIVVFHRFQD